MRIFENKDNLEVTLDMASMLNLVNVLPDDMAEYLRDLDINLERCDRRLDLYVSHNDIVVAIGYENDSLVWFSRTMLSDTLSLRRVFESMKQSYFYRRALLSDVLLSANMTIKDLQYMCNVRIENISIDKPVFSGCIVGSCEADVMTGMDFAKAITALPEYLKASIGKIGSDDDIISKLEKDFQTLERLRFSVEDKDERRERMTEISEKWRRAECLKLSERASIRSLYHDVCFFDMST